MVFKTIISFICGLYRFYPVLPMGITDCFTQFYPTGFTHWVKLPCQPCVLSMHPRPRPIPISSHFILFLHVPSVLEMYWVVLTADCRNSVCRNRVCRNSVCLPYYCKVGDRKYGIILPSVLILLMPMLLLLFCPNSCNTGTL